MARADRELGKLEEGLKNIKETLDRHDHARQRLYDKVDQVDAKVTKMEPRVEQIEKRLGEMQQPVQAMQIKEHEAAGIRKFSRLVWLVLGAVAGTLISGTQFIRSLF